MTTITQTISTSDYPSREFPLEFPDKADAQVTFVSVTLPTEMNVWATQANTVKSEINVDKLAAAQSVIDAAASASTATTQAGIATTQASNAATSATNAANAYDAFDDRYLGSKASDPTVDNDGSALITGALYFNSASSQMKAWSGTAWVNTTTIPTDHSALTSRDIAGNHSKLIPAADSTTAIQLAKANGTSIVNVDTTNSRVGINTTTPSVNFEIKSTEPIAAVLGSELITNTVDRDFSGSGNWSGISWSVAGGVLTHTANASAVGLANTYLNEAIVAGATYQLVFTITTTTAGTLAPNIGGTSGIIVGKQVNSEVQTMVFVSVSSTNQLTFTANSTWKGYIDNVSLKRITPVKASLQLKDSAGNICNELTFNGTSNTFLGVDSGKNRTNGTNNIAIGNHSQYSITSGTDNIATGYYSQYSLTTGYNNITNGSLSQYYLTTGTDNIANGYFSQHVITTGSNNIASGTQSQYNLTTGNNNVANGYKSQYSLTTGTDNIATGYYSQNYLTTGSNNVASGSYSQYNLTTGNNNVALGYSAGYIQADGATALTDPEYSIYIGASSKGYNNDDNNTIVIGYNAIGKGANTTVLGNSGITNTTIGGNILPYTADTYDIGSSTLQYDDIYATNATIQTSDARLKENIVDLYISSAFLEKLRPVSFKWKDYVIPEETALNDVQAKDEDGNLLYNQITETNENGIETTRQEPVFIKETVVIRPEIIKTHTRKHCGLIAQEVEQAILDIGMTTEDFAALCYDSATDKYSVRYTELIPVLIRGWQDQQSKIKELEARLIVLESKE